MASPSVLNAADLLAPIAGADPAGVPIDRDFTVIQDLDAARKDYEPHPEGPVPKKPEWDKITRIAVKKLTDESKDLRLAVRLTEALTKNHGPAGLRDGLALIRGLIEQCWDRLFPIPDPDDFETLAIRGELLANSLSDPTAGIMFPHSLRSLPLVSIDGKPYSLYDKRLADEGREGLTYTREDFARAQPLDANTLADLDQALEQLHGLREALTAKLERDAPNLSKLDEAIREVRQFVSHFAPTPAPAAAGPGEGDAAGAAGAQGMPLPGRGPATREEAYRQIAQIASVLEQLEPHSPIPDLLRRAVELGRMPFRKLIREIVREQTLLNEVNREFGIKEPPSE